MLNNHQSVGSGEYPNPGWSYYPMADGGGYSAQYQPTGPRSFMPFRAARSPPRTNETPSPSRSPGPQSPNGNYGIYNQHGHQQHLLLNGGGGPSHQRYTMQMNLGT